MRMDAYSRQSTSERYTSEHIFVRFQHPELMLNN